MRRTPSLRHRLPHPHLHLSRLMQSSSKSKSLLRYALLADDAFDRFLLTPRIVCEQLAQLGRGMYAALHLKADRAHSVRTATVCVTASLWLDRISPRAVQHGAESHRTKGTSVLRVVWLPGLIALVLLLQQWKH